MPVAIEAFGNPSDSWQSLPSALDYIRQAIETSRSLLALEDDWDEAGSHPIAESTWRRAAEFLARHARWILDTYGEVIKCPDIDPGPDESIDLHWDHPDYRLLINIPADLGALAGFYGDDRGSISIKGKFDPSRMTEPLLRWLKKAS